MYTRYIFTDLYELGVDFEVRGRNIVFFGLPLALLDSLEQVVHGPGNDTDLILWKIHIKPCPHGVSLPRPGL